MSRSNRRINGIVSFAAGFGTGYLNGERQKEEKARQDELDKIRIEQNQRDRTEFEDKQEVKRKDALLNNELNANAQPTYENKTNIAAEGLTAALPDVFSDEAEQSAYIPGMVDERKSATQPATQSLTGLEKAEHFMANSTPEQQQRYGNFYAQQGKSATGNEVFTKGDNGGLAVADKRQAQAKPLWQTMLDQSLTLITNENSRPEHRSMAYDMAKKATEMKSEAYMQKILEARKGGLPALLALANGHSNDELPYTDLKVEPTADGKARLAGVDSSTGKPFEKVYDLKDGSIEDQITQDLSNLASPTMMLNGIAAKISATQASRKDAREERKVDISEKKIEFDRAMTEYREDRRDDRQNRQIAAADHRATMQNDTNQNRVTPTQEANNKEIQLARKRLSGMTPADISDRTLEFDQAGRKNKNYDPTLASTWRTANQRMVGQDDQFDSFSNNAKPIKQPQGESQSLSPKNRFTQDPAMKGMTMGGYTSKGWMVKDANGKLVGYYK